MTVDRAQVQTLHDSMDPVRASALHAVLDLPGPPPGPGDALLPFFHHVYFWEVARPGDLGRDGHPAVGGLIPNTGFPRRMWAAGSLQFHEPLLLGQAAEKHSRVAEVTHKKGRSGALAFVTLTHEIWQGETLCLTEEQTLVYRPDPQQGDVKPDAPQSKGQADQPLHFDAVTLARYSALTFNGHRIHYDPDYARDVEGYGGCVVHGPLLAQLMMLRAAQAGPLARFSYRGASPLILGEAAQLGQDGAALWVEGPGGRLLTTGTAAWA